MKQRVVSALMATVLGVSLCACSKKPESTAAPTQATNPETQAETATEPDIEDVLLPVTFKETARLVVGDESFDIKSVVELKAGHTMNELAYTIASDESVASVDENGVLTRKSYGQVSVSISLKDKPAVFNIFNVTFAPAGLYDATYSGGFKKADGSLGNEITLALKNDKTFTLTVGEGKAKYMDTDYDLDAKAVGKFTGTFAIDASSATPILLTSADYSAEPIKGAFGKTADGAFCIRVKLNTAVVEGELKSVVIELTAK